MSYPYLTKEQFVATRHVPTDDEWNNLQEHAAEGTLHLPPREDCILYAEMHLIHKADGHFYSHAWWYKPNRNATLEEAEEDQYNWYNEFMDDPNGGRKYDVRINEGQRKILQDAMRRLIRADDVITSEEHELLSGMLEDLPTDGSDGLNDFTL